jgi:LPXTG-site transpeptidase (sortase) family protein
MLERLRNIDRQTGIALAMVAGALVVLVIGVSGIVLALRSDGVELPGEGSISDIAGEETAAAVAEPPPFEPGPPALAPTRLAIPSLYLDAPMIPLGMTADSQPEVPKRPDQVAWYPSFSSAPGRPGNAVLTGHVDWQTPDGAPIPGVFYRLREMRIGDLIEVTLEDGSKLQYRVRANVATEYNDPRIVDVMQATGKDVITVITCGGAWVKNRSEPNGGNYSHRVIVRAERVHALAENVQPAANGD